MYMAPALNCRFLPCACLALALACPSICGAQAVGDLVSADATVRGSVQTVATGTRVMSGSSVTAGSTTAALKLARGGEVRVCPRSSVSLTLSPSGQDLAMALGTGGMETHFRLRSSADIIMTPDFRILLAGPGNFDYAVAADARGNTCVKALASNTSSLIVSEIMGDGTYQVQPGQQVYFRNGSVANPGNTVPPDCGCPPPFPVTNTARTVPRPAPQPPVASPATPKAEVQPASAQSEQSQPAGETKVAAASPEALLARMMQANGVKPKENAPAPQPQPQEIHVQVDAPMIVHGDQARTVPPAPTVAKLSLVEMPQLISDAQATTVLPPEKLNKQKTADKAPKAKSATPAKGFFGHIKSFFGSIFRR
jgi:hypothetical protein